MASIPLPALAVQTPQEPDLLGQYGKAMALKSMMQNQQLQGQEQQENAIAIQQRQLQLKDAQTLQQIAPQHVVKDANGQVTGYDWNGLINDAASKQVSVPTLQGLQKTNLEIQTQLLGLSEKQRVDKEAAIGDLYNHVEAIRGVQDPAQRVQVQQQLFPQIQQSAPKVGIDPGQLQQLQQKLTQPLTDDELNHIEAGLGMHQQQIADASKAATTQMDVQKGNEAAQNAQKIELENKFLQEHGGMTQTMADANYRFLQQKKAAGQPLSPDDQNFVTAYEKQKLLVPAATANIRLEGMAQSREYPVYDTKTKSPTYVSAAELNRAKTEEPGRYTIASFTPEAIQAQGAAKASVTPQVANELVSYNTAIAHAGLLQKAADALDNGDVKALNSLRNEFQTQLGSPNVTNFQAIANVYNNEVANAISKGHMTDSEVKQAGLALPTNASPEQIKGAVNAFAQLMASKKQIRVNQIQQGAQGQMPVNAPTQTTGSDGMVTVQIPGSPPGKIPAASLDKFKQDHPNATVSQ